MDADVRAGAFGLRPVPPRGAFAVRISAVLLSGLLAALSACDRGASSVARAEETVDSVVPRAVALERFRAGLPATTGLAGGEASRDALVRAFVAAVEAADTAKLVRLAMTRAEFAYLYYPTNPEGLPPYDLSPGLMWTLLETRHRQGLFHLLEERAGRPLHAAGYRCDGTARRQGENQIVGPCVIRRREAGGVIEEQLFGLIIERGGRFKFVSLSNALD